MGIDKDLKEREKMQIAVFGSGCFWCTEAIFDEVKGVKGAEAGYAGGKIPNPTYKEVCSGYTGHAEVVKVTYDPAEISFEELLEIFWKTHDPTSLNRQGADVGTQYRSVIFYVNDAQKKTAERIKKELDASGAWDRPIVTEISPLGKFYIAEDYHQDYFEKNPYEGYCQFVIGPKMEKFRKVFEEKLRK
ncbi:MAG: peptide-methionine (S)-S-oxide reductase MsrA [Bacteroidota bacterium]|nr:peptide-methionine (S)-S-oxide reductase MsrA [Bacteroidota bacterium]